MRYDQVTLAPPLTRVTKYLIIVSTACFFLSLAQKFVFPQFDLNDVFGLVPYHVVVDYWGWQFVTYLFLHGNAFHLLFNMLVLWFFGAEIEMRMGERRFFTYLLICGVGAGLCSLSVNLMLHPVDSLTTPVIGSSGAIYGLLAAYGLFFWDRYLLMFFLFPIKAQYYVLIMGALELAMGLGQNDNVSHVAHLGGLLIGGAYVYFRYFRHGGGRKSKKDIEKEKLKRQFTLIVNESLEKGKDDKGSSGPFWN